MGDGGAVSRRRGAVGSGGRREWDVWHEVRRRWLVGGVLAAVALAVLAPHAGAAGGLLRAQYVCHLPLSYIYYTAGRRRGRVECAEGAARLAAASGAHAALVAPALAVVLCAGAARAHVHPALVQGVLLSAAGGGCGWLSLALCSHSSAAPAVAVACLVSLLTTPAATLLLCGRGAVAAPGAVAAAWGAALCAWGAGAAMGRRSGASVGAAPVPAVGARACALALLYMQCCEALVLRGSVRVEDMFAMLVLECSWVALSAGACWGYARCGLLAPRDARAVALCALPKGPHVGWHLHAVTACAGSALARLPGVLLAPAQALLLATIAADEDSPPPYSDVTPPARSHPEASERGSLCNIQL